MSYLLDEGPEDEENAREHPRLDGRQPLRLWRVGRHRVEDVDEHEEQGDEQRHPPGNHVHGDEERDPGDDDEQSRGQVVGDDVGGDVAVEHHLEAGQGKVAQGAAEKHLEKKILKPC